MEQPKEPEVETMTGDEDDTEVEVTIGAADESDPRNEDHGRNHDTRDGDDEMNDRGHTEDAPERRLGDELGRIDLMTTPEGYVEGRVTELESLDETTVRLEVTLPHGSTTTFRLEKPIPWSRGFLLARIVEDVGYDAASIEHMVGEPVLLERVDLSHDESETRWEWDVSDWRDGVVRTTGNALLSSLGGRFRLEEDTPPEWRLVDPLERRSPEPDSARDWRRWGSVGLVLGGTLVMVTGVLIALGSVALSGSVLASAVPGFGMVVLGLYWLVHATRDRAS